jgi:hypothetical protein
MVYTCTKDTDPIEAERRRRVWYLIYNADKVTAAAMSRPVFLRSDEFRGPDATSLPTEAYVSGLGYD